jgi:hypothetical protein
LPIWKAACANVKGFPIRFPDLSLPAFVSLLYDEDCMVCAKKCTKIDFHMRIRCCSECAPANVVHFEQSRRLIGQVCRWGYWLRGSVSSYSRRCPKPCLGKAFQWQHLPQSTRYNTPYIFKPHMELWQVGPFASLRAIETARTATY